MDNKNNELVELRKKIEADLDKMTADQMKAFAVNMCYAYHKELNELNVSQDVKRIIAGMAHNNQVFEVMLIRRLERSGYFDKDGERASE